MAYKVAIKKDFKYIKTYRVVKRVNETTNAASKAFQKLVNKYILKKQEDSR